MITQTITASMTQTHLTKILTRRYDVGREIKFILYKDELLSDPIDLTDYTVVITVIKPDNNFVIENFSGDTVTITEQMEAVTGTGYYCVHVTKGTETIYTGQGEFIIDDVLISDDELESISEVNGLKFPDDFLTVEDHVAVIDDTVTTTEKTWSSSKISEEIENDSVVVSKTAEGNPIEISDAADAPLVECKTEIQGSQDLHGYDKPWVGGAGKNKLNNAQTNWTNNGFNNTSIHTLTTIPVVSGASYTLSCAKNATEYPNLFVYISKDVAESSSTFITSGALSLTAPFTFTIPEDVTDISFRIRTSNYGAEGQILYDAIGTDILMQCEQGSTATAYEPYSNICPITAYTEGKIEVSDGDGNTTTHTTTYPSAIYRGSEDVVNGKVVTEWGMIASYAGESLPGEWISDRDGYAPGTTPTTGAQVAYELATPTTSSVTPTNLPIKSLLGYNHIESTTGNIEIEYITPDYQPLVESIVTESESRITKLWDAGFTPAPGVWLEYDFGEDLENYDAIVILFVVSGWEGNNSDSVTVYPKIQNLNTTKYYNYIKGSDYGIQFWHVSGTTYGLGSIDGNYPPQYKAVYGIKY